MESYKVQVTDEAKSDMREAVRYIAVDLRQPDTASSLLDSFDKEVSTLETMPERYGYVKDEHLASLGFRMTMTGKYLLFYIVDHTAKTVTVIRVLHGRRDWISILTSCSNKQEQGGINC